MSKKVWGILSSCALGIITLAILGGCAYLAMGTGPSKKDLQRFSKSSHFNKERQVFVNRNVQAFNNMNKRKKFSGGWFNFLFGNENQRRPETELPVLKPKLKDFLATSVTATDSDDIKVIWFGHSSFLLNFEGKIILVDPILSTYASPLPFVIGRFQPAPLTLEELPPVDYVLISHDHYDHLDMATIKHFREKKTKFMVPLGVGAHLKGWGIDPAKIHEFDWWDRLNFAGVDFIATPAQHFSGRSFSNRNSTLWSGWIIKSDQKRVFFSGDSGYDIHFKEIGEKYGPFDIAFIENGQYNVSWKEVHLMPEQGVQAFYDLKAKIYFPVHWGAFTLSLHPWFEPAEKVYQYSLARKFPIIIPNIGELVKVNQAYKTRPWWENFKVK